jgi:CRP/FNR family cyclic AMP-dependent transcriptional regulator
METLERILLEHRLFAGLDPKFAALLVGCAKNVRFEAGDYLFREGSPADELYLVRHGRVALEISAPGRGSMTFQTIEPGELVGLSWLVPPYRWAFDARALDLTRAISLDARCLRNKCEADHDLGYDLMKRFTPVLLERLHATRLQILDIYGKSD